MEWIAGADGCKAGWVVAFAGADRSDEVRVRVVAKFADIFAAPEQPRIVAVDIPIGLPAHVGPEGRGPERAVRPLLGERQSSVFAVPSRPGFSWSVAAGTERDVGRHLDGGGLLIAGRSVVYLSEEAETPG